MGRGIRPASVLPPRRHSTTAQPESPSAYFMLLSDAGTRSSSHSPTCGQSARCERSRTLRPFTTQISKSRRKSLGSRRLTPSGVFTVAALVARAMADPLGMAEALAGFLDATRRPTIGLDLTLGRSSTLLGAAILLDAILGNNLVDPAPMRSFGDAALAEIWQAIDAKAPIATADVEYLGIAHGWAGFLYATLQWCRVSRTPVPTTVERRLEELAAFALPSGRGLEWPWVLHRPGEPMTMAGWCNGTCGYVFLWTLAHRLLGHPRYL